MSDTARWYVVHTYSGYENKVASNLEKTVENSSFVPWQTGCAVIYLPTHLKK